MKIFGISILPAKTFESIFDKAVMAGHFEERNEILLNRIYVLNGRLRSSPEELEITNAHLNNVSERILDLEDDIKHYIQIAKN